MKQVTEEMRPQDDWFKKAKAVETIDDMVALAKELFDETQHDYGTVCHACGALALAGAWYGAKKEGITGFQAGFVMWDFIRQWNYETNKCGLKIIDYDNMLYPQYEDKFEKVISKRQWESIQKAAKERLEENTDFSYVHPEVKKHWQSIVDGVVPFGFKVKDED